MNNFLNSYTLVVIDCTRQNEFIKSGIMDVRLNLNSNWMYQRILSPIVSSYTIMISNIVYYPT